MAVLKGWRFVGFVSCLLGGIGLTLYPVIIDPMLNTEKYKQMQKYTGAQREELQRRAIK